MYWHISSYCHFLTCFYDFINLQDSFTYLHGVATSRCSDWASMPSRSYRNLCKNNGKIYPEVSKIFSICIFISSIYPVITISIIFCIQEHGTEGSKRSNEIRF